MKSNKIKEENIFKFELIIKEEAIVTENVKAEKFTNQTESNGNQSKADEPNREPQKEKVIQKKEHPPPMQFDEPMECEMCSEAFKTNIAFALHSIEHSDDKKYHCHLCSTFRSSHKYTMEMHVRTHEGATNFKCEICNKAFPAGTYAVEHKYFHTGEKPFQCEICGKSFMYSRLLTSHRLLSHEEILKNVHPTKYDCPICKNHYKSLHSLRMHNLKKHSEVTVDTSVLCDVCGIRLVSKAMLKLHLRTHTGYKPFECQVCSKTFSQRRLLTEHGRVHTGEKPFVCKHCSKGFSQQTSLKVHERIHTGERPYKCSICGKGYMSKGSRDIHSKSCLKKT